MTDMTNEAANRLPVSRNTSQDWVRAPRDLISRRDFLTVAAGSLGTLMLARSLLAADQTASASTGRPRPNILLVMADDMGFSDVGCFGGEIQTPQIDALSSRGVRFAQFYNTARCCPTRASLLTGLHPHQVGLGWMTVANFGVPGYRGDLGRNGVTIAEALSASGYRTYMSGKWHVVHHSCEGPDGPKYNWPCQRGFDRFYGTIRGDGSYFEPASLTRDNEQIKPPKDFYYTDAISDSMVDCIRDHKRNHSEKPFFGYVSYTSPHWPLHALKEDIQEYIKVYEVGWDKIRAARHRPQIESGPLDGRWDLSPQDSPSWAKVPGETKPLLVKRMAVYAAQIASMDRGIGRIVQALRKTGQYENTLIFFLSDNGGSAEQVSKADKAIDVLGTNQSFESYRREWANVSNAPFRMYKYFIHEGGIATPLIVHWPAHVAPRKEPVREPGHVMDIMATCLGAARVQYPTQYKGYSITPLEGRSLLSALKGGRIGHDALFWEHSSNRAVRHGKWKLVLQRSVGEWELYDMEADRTEVHDLASQYPRRAAKMASMWDNWAKRCQVYPLCSASWPDRISMDKGPPGPPTRP